MAGSRLAGKVAIVTGAGSRAEGIGNGRRRRRLFAREGARVSAWTGAGAAAEATRAMIAAEGGEAAVLRGGRHAERGLSRHGGRGRCAAGAAWTCSTTMNGHRGPRHRGGGGRGGLGSPDESERDQHDADLKHAIPAMARGGGGSIINISSISALRPRGSPVHRLQGRGDRAHRAMAVDHAAQGVRVNCIAPGPVYTPMVFGDGMTAELQERRREASPLGIEGTGWDIGNAALFLASDEARLHHGGWCCRWTEASR